VAGSRTTDTSTVDPPCGAPEQLGTGKDWTTTFPAKEEDLERVPFQKYITQQD